jgi:hypothetical protein
LITHKAGVATLAMVAATAVILLGAGHPTTAGARVATGTASDAAQQITVNLADGTGRVLHGASGGDSVDLPVVQIRRRTGRGFPPG